MKQLFITTLTGLALWSTMANAAWIRHENIDVSTNTIENVELHSTRATEIRYRWIKSKMFYNCDQDYIGVSLPVLIKSNDDNYERFADIVLNKTDKNKLEFTLHKLGEHGYELHLADGSKSMDEMRYLLFNNELNSVKIGINVKDKDYRFEYDTSNFNIDLCD